MVACAARAQTGAPTTLVTSLAAVTLETVGVILVSSMLCVVPYVGNTER